MAVNLEKITQIYDELAAATTDWLRDYANTDEGELEDLLQSSDIRSISTTRLNALFKMLEQTVSFVEVNLYSVQPRADVERTYYVEVKPVSQDASEFRFEIPLHASLSPEHAEEGEAESFFKFLFIQVSALQYAGSINIEITKDYIEEVFQYFYKLLQEAEHIKEETLMERKGDLLSFKPNSNEGETILVEERKKDSVDAPEVESEEFYDFEGNMEEEVYGLGDNLEEEEGEYSFEDDAEDDEISDFTNNSLEQEEGSKEFVAVDFTSLNVDLNDMFKLTDNLDERQAIKVIKADVWELEMNIDATGLEVSEAEKLAYSVLSLETEASEVMKRQIDASKRLLASIINR